MNQPPELPDDAVSRNTKRWIAFVVQIVLLIGYMLGFDFLIMGNLPFEGLVRFFFDIVGVWLLLKYPIALFMIVSVGSIVIHEQMHPTRNLFLPSLAYGLVWLSYFYALFRYTVIRRTLCSWALSRFWYDPPASSLPAPVRFAVELERSLTIVKLFAVLLVAGLLLRNQPLAIDTSPWISWSQANKQVFWPGTTLIVVVIGTMVLINETSWRSHSTQQARIYLRSLFIGLQYADLRRIGIARRKYKASQLEQVKKSKSNQSKGKR